MAFIPIDAKADVQGSKKGKLTPEQHAILNAWCLASKTGILDCLGKCTAKLSVIPFDTNSYEATVKFNKGYFVVCGRLVECEEGTEVKLQLSQQNVQQGAIVARFNLSALGNNELQIITVSDSDNLYTEDLNENPITGKYDFVLYDYTADMSLGTVRLTRRGNYIPDLSSKLEEFENKIEDLEKFLTVTVYGEVSAVSHIGLEQIVNSSLQKLGNKVKITLQYSDIYSVTFNDTSERRGWEISIPTDFAPKNTLTIPIDSGVNISSYIKVETDGKISFMFKKKTTAVSVVYQMPAVWSFEFDI